MEGLVTVTAIVLNAPALMDMQERTVKYLQVYTVTLTYEPMVDIPSFLCHHRYVSTNSLFDFYLNYHKIYELGGQCNDMNPRCSSHAHLCDSNSDYRAVCRKTCGDCKGTFEF